MTMANDTLCRLYIDADNQPRTLVPALASLLATLQRRQVHAVVVGNSNGRHVEEWADGLMESIPGIAVDRRVTRLRRESADAQLMFELGALYHGAPNPLDLVVVVSRDELLIAATEILAAQGHAVLLAVGATQNAALIASTTPVVLLPSGTLEAMPTVSQASPDTTPTNASSEHARVIALIQLHTKREADGGYLLTNVGAVLAKHGHGKGDRKRLIREIPARRAGSKRGDVLHFD